MWFNAQLQKVIKLIYALLVSFVVEIKILCKKIKILFDESLKLMNTEW